MKTADDPLEQSKAPIPSATVCFDPSPAEREQILDALRQALQARPDVLFAYAYGSILEDRPVHDVDVAVYLAPGAIDHTPFPAADLVAQLERALPTGLDLAVDVRLLNDAPTGFRYHAFRGQFLCSRDEEARATLVEDTVRTYLDLEPILRQALKEAMAA
jgi:predicted nucleotidyltransferase